MATNSAQVVTARSERVTMKEIGDEVIVYDLDTDQAHLLDPITAAVWRAASGGAPTGLLRAVVETKVADASTVDDVLFLALGELQQAGLLVAQADTVQQSSLISRRSMLKKAGFALAALPVITTILAPPAAATHSGPLCTPDGGDCPIAPDHCCSPLCSSSGLCCSAALTGSCTTILNCCEGNLCAPITGGNNSNRCCFAVSDQPPLSGPGCANDDNRCCQDGGNPNKDATCQGTRCCVRAGNKPVGGYLFCCNPGLGLTNGGACR